MLPLFNELSVNQEEHEEHCDIEESLVQLGRVTCHHIIRQTVNIKVGTSAICRNVCIIKVFPVAHKLNAPRQCRRNAKDFAVDEVSDTNKSTSQRNNDCGFVNCFKIRHLRTTRIKPDSDKDSDCAAVTCKTTFPNLQNFKRMA